MRSSAVATSITATLFVLVIRSGLVEAVRPAVSDSVLFQMCAAASQATGVAIGGSGLEDRFIIKNRKHAEKCLDLFRGRHTVFNKVIRYTCGNNPDNQLVWLKHVGGGYVSIVFKDDLCIGSGYDVGSKIYVTKGDEWCERSQSNRFAMTIDGNFVRFEQAENGLCVTSPDNGEDLYVDHCTAGDPRQQFILCEPSDKKCWPKQPPVQIRV